jgi:hypothetical protein
VFVYDAPVAQGPAVFVATLPRNRVLIQRDDSCGRCSNKLVIVPRVALFPPGTPAREREAVRE